MILTTSISCNQQTKGPEINIIFLHHSTGGIIWNGTKTSLASKVARRINNKLSEIVSKRAHLPSLFKNYNKDNKTNYHINEMYFPKEYPYGWNNYPFDYYNIWVKNAGGKPYLDEPTLEILTKDYQIIIFKHCFPVSNIVEDQDAADINSNIKTLSNYKLQYLALRDKLHEFPNTKFIIWTGAIQVKSNITHESAQRAQDFFKWVINDWDLPNDNIFLWDFNFLETEGGLYFKEEYALSSTNSHPNKKFAGKAVKLLFNRIIDVIENDGRGTLITGHEI